MRFQAVDTENNVHIARTHLHRMIMQSNMEWSSYLYTYM